MNEEVRRFTWLALVKPRPSQCTCSTPSLTSHVHGSKHGSSTSSSELSTRGVCVEVGVGVGPCDAWDRRAHPRATTRVTHCILLLLPFQLSSLGLRRGIGPLSHCQARRRRIRSNTQTYTHTGSVRTNRQGRRRRSHFSINQIGDTS